MLITGALRCKRASGFGVMQVVVNVGRQKKNNRGVNLSRCKSGKKGNDDDDDDASTTTTMTTTTSGTRWKQATERIEGRRNRFIWKRVLELLMVLCSSIDSAGYKLGTVNLTDKSSGNPTICMEYCALIPISASDSAFDAKFSDSLKS